MSDLPRITQTADGIVAGEVIVGQADIQALVFFLAERSAILRANAVDWGGSTPARYFLRRAERADALLAKMEALGAWLADEDVELRLRRCAHE